MIQNREVIPEEISLKAQIAIDYCQGVKDDNVIRDKKLFKMPVYDDNSILINISEKKTALMFRASKKAEQKYYVREVIAEKLQRINQVLLSQNKSLIIISTWRSYKDQRCLLLDQIKLCIEQHPKKTHSQIDAIISHFVAPETQSMHTTGGAVDALIFDNELNQILDFGTNDKSDINFGVLCYPFHPDASIEARKNRKLLIDIFECEGFVVDPKAFWHFDYGNVAWAVEKQHDFAIFGPIFI